MSLLQSVWNASNPTAHRSQAPTFDQSDSTVQRGLTPVEKQSDSTTQRGLTPVEEQSDSIAQRSLTPVEEQSDFIAQRGLTPVEEQSEQSDSTVRRTLTSVEEQLRQSDSIAEQSRVLVVEQSEQSGSISQRSLNPVIEQSEQFGESRDAVLVGEFANDSLINGAGSDLYSHPFGVEELNPIANYLTIDGSQTNFESEQMMGLYSFGSQSAPAMSALESSDRLASQSLTADSFLNFHSALNALIIRSGLS